MGGRFTLPKIKVSRKEVREFIKKRGLPFKKKYRKRARAKLRARKERQALPRGKDISGVATDASWNIAYGTVQLGGVITQMEISDNKKFLHLILSLTGHQISGINRIYFDQYQLVFPLALNETFEQQTTGSLDPDGNASTEYATKVRAALHDGDKAKAALGPAISLMPNSKWTSDHRQYGRSHAYLILEWDAKLFGEGLPDIIFEINGKEVFDPRSSLTVFSSNAALCLADFMTDDEYGLGIPYSRIDEPALIAAANVCDETVATLSGSENRYEVNGYWEADATPGEIVDEMLQAMAGDLVYAEGKWKILAGEYRAPTLSLDENDLRGPIAITTKTSRRDTFNVVKGTYVSKTNNYEVTDFPAVREQLYVDDDGKEIFEEMSFPLVTSSAQAQRLAKIELRRMRQDVLVEGVFSLKAFELDIGDTVNLNIDRTGFASKIFEIEEMQLVEAGGDAGSAVINVFLSMREMAPEIYDFPPGDELEVDPTPNTNLPDPFSVGVPQNVQLFSGTAQLFVRGDGTVFSRIKVTWDAFDDFFVTSGGEVEIQYKRSSEPDAEYRNAPNVPASENFTFILEVEDAIEYDVRLRGKNPLGATSDYVTVFNHTVIGKTAPPSDVQGLRCSFTQFGIRIEWDQIPDLDRDVYLLRIGSTVDTFDSATPVAELKGTSFTERTRIADTYRIFVKAQDTSGNLSVNATFKDATIPAPAAPTGFTIAFEGPNMVLSWNEVPATIFNIEEYILRFGTDSDTFATASDLATTKALSFRQRIEFTGARRFFVAARDVGLNIGAAAVLDASIDPPSKVTNLRPEVIDNNVLLRWGEPNVHTLPIDHYKVYRGDVFATAELVGQADTTFVALFEILSGTFTYWVTAVDTAGNEGPEVGTEAFVDEPPDFEVFDDLTVDLSTVDELVNAKVIDDDPSTILCPIFVDKTYEEHFQMQSITTPQQQIDAGYPRYIQPNAQWARVVKIIDHGVTLPASIITVNFLRDDIVSSPPQETLTVGYSLDGISYTEVEGQSRIFASSYRYVRVKFEKGCPPEEVIGQPVGLLLALTYDGSG